MTALLGQPRDAEKAEEHADVERTVEWFFTRRCGLDAFLVEVVRTDLFTDRWFWPKPWARSYHLTADGSWAEHEEGGSIEPAAVLAGPLVRLLCDLGVLVWDRADGTAAWPVERPAPVLPRASWWRRFLGWSR